MKTLSYKIEDGIVIVTGDSTKGTDVPTDKQFQIGEPLLVDMEMPSTVKIFFFFLLQENHEYSFPAAHKDIVIDGIQYYIDDYGIKNPLSRESHHFPRLEPRNFFKLYCDFVKFLHRQQQLNNLEEKLNLLLEKFGIDKAVSSIERSDDGIHIRVSKYTYQEKRFPDFLLLLSNDNGLKFQHFFEREGEYYSNGDTPLRHEDIVKELERQRRLLNKYDELYEMFNNVVL
jgi:hypothetical protein